MLKDLVKISNELDKRGLAKEADFLDNIIVKKAHDDEDRPKKRPSFLSIVPPDDNSFHFHARDPDSSIGFRPTDVDALEKYRQEQIAFYDNEANLNRGSTSGEQSALSDAIMEKIRLEDASHEELMAEIKSEENFGNAIKNLNFIDSFSGGRELESEENKYETFLKEAFNKNFSQLVRNYGISKLQNEVERVYGRSVYDIELELDDGATITLPDALNTPQEQAFEIMRRNDDSFFKALKSLPLSAIIAYLTTSTSIIDGTTADFWEYEDLLKPAAKQNPIELQYIYEFAPNKELKLELKEYMAAEDEWSEDE